MITDVFFPIERHNPRKLNVQSMYTYLFAIIQSTDCGEKSLLLNFFLKPLYYQPAITKILCILLTSPSQVPNWEPLLYTYFFIYKHTINYFIICFNYYLHDKTGFTLNHKRETVQIVNSASDEKSTAQKCV